MTESLPPPTPDIEGPVDRPNRGSPLRVQLGKQLRELTRSRGPAAFLMAALVVGVGVGLGAALLVTSVELLSSGADSAQRSAGGYRAIYLALIPTGLVTAWAINQRWGPGIRGGGVSETMIGLSLRSGYLPTRSVAAKIAATAATLGLGASGGREGPAVQIGATIGSSLARHTRFGDDQIRSLVAAGAGAGIGATFNAPIAGMLFAVEVILGNLAIRHLNAVVVASVAAAVTTRSLVGAESILSAPPHVLAHPAELILYGALGVLAFGLSIGFLKLIGMAEHRRKPARAPDWMRPAAAGLVVATVGLFEPDILGTGQEVVRSVLRLTAGTTEVWWVLAALAVGKIATYALSLYGDGSAGEFMPSLFIGAMAGGALALLIGPAWGFSTLNPGAFAVVGMAATFAAVAKAPLTSILIVFEITGDYGLVLPLMLASSLATFLTDRVHPESAYTLPIKLKGIHLPRREDVDLLDTVTVGQIMSRDVTALGPHQTSGTALELLQRGNHHGMPVLDGGKLVGVVSLSDIRLSGGPSDSMTVREIMTKNPVTATPGLPVSAALARMAALEVGRLPVVAEDTPTRLVGIFRRASVVHAYHHALGSTTDRAMYRQRLQQKTLPGAAFYEVTIPVLSPVDGLTVRDIEWPEEATLVSIRRGGAVLIPHGGSVLCDADTLTAFGTAESRRQVVEMVEPGSKAVSG